MYFITIDLSIRREESDIFIYENLAVRGKVLLKIYISAREKPEDF